MTNRTWNGATADFTTAADWSPAGVPVSGDTAIISSGTVLANRLTFTGLQVVVQSSSGAGGTLQLLGATNAAGSAITMTNPNSYGMGTAPTIQLQGRNVNAGTVTLTGTVSNLTFATDSTGVAGALINTGTINITNASPQVNTAGNTTAVFQNDGTINITNPGTSNFQSPVINVLVSGTGTINLSNQGKVDFRMGTSAGQRINYGGVNASDVVQIENASAFKGTLGNFVAGNSILVSNTPYTSATYTATGASSGTLNLFSGTTQQAALSFSGVYSLSSFGLSYNDLGNGASNLIITTNVQNAASGSTTASTASGPVYRFFDTVYGTHFFTSDVGEKNTVISTRSDLLQETNGFGNVAQSDPNAAAVYRFFDTRLGTHFFTASAAERDTIRATRADLTYEPNSTFYEHATQQTGDVAVYRFFDTQYGTHFYTGDAGEFTGLTSVGSSTYRANLTYEGVGFYAPSGTFT